MCFCFKPECLIENSVNSRKPLKIEKYFQAFPELPDQNSHFQENFKHFGKWLVSSLYIYTLSVRTYTIVLIPVQLPSRPSWLCQFWLRGENVHVLDPEPTTPCQRYVVLTPRVNLNPGWPCLLGGVYVPCIYRVPGGLIVGDSGLCCCLPV